LSSISFLRETLRVGDIAGLKFTTTAVLNKQVMIEVIRAPDRVLLGMNQHISLRGFFGSYILIAIFEQMIFKIELSSCGFNKC
jgi:hypothetical protein